MSLSRCKYFLTTGLRTLIVDADSASPQLPGVTYYGIEATHSSICKFDSSNAPGYLTVSTALRDWVGEASSVIKIRWALEDEDRDMRARRDADERRMSLVSPTTLFTLDNEVVADLATVKMTAGPIITGPSRPNGM